MIVNILPLVNEGLQRSRNDAPANASFCGKSCVQDVPKPLFRKTASTQIRRISIDLCCTILIDIGSNSENSIYWFCQLSTYYIDMFGPGQQNIHCRYFFSDPRFPHADLLIEVNLILTVFLQLRVISLTRKNFFASIYIFYILCSVLSISITALIKSV